MAVAAVGTAEALQPLFTDEDPRVRTAATAVPPSARTPAVESHAEGSEYAV